MDFIPQNITRSGIDVLGDIGRASHIGHIFKDMDELFEIVIPYLKAGLEQNELCVWIGCERLQSDYIAALQRRLAKFNDFAAKGQFHLLSREHFCGLESFEPHNVIQMITDMQEIALRNGFKGLRIAQSFPSANKAQQILFSEYDKFFGELINKYDLTVLGSFAFVDVDQVLEIAANHCCTVMKHDGQWQKLKINNE